MTQFSDTKFFSITGSIGSRLFMLIPLLAVLTGIEHLRSTIISSFPHITQRGEITQKCPRMRRGITLGIFLAIFAYGVYAALVTKITETTITTDKISHDLKILLVADFHVDDILSTIHLKALKKQIELQQPDIILIAGDFFNKANARLATYYEVLSGINIPMYAIEGNHDMMGNEEKGLALRQIEALTNIHFLYNESIVFPERNLQLIGIEEKGQWRNTNPNEIKALEETIQSTHLQYNDTFNILMTHQPIHLAKTRSLPINLEVAGHTHKLQIRGLHFLSYLLNDYTYGLYERQDRKAFVTQGIGTR
jgi:predicted MPP superfamily phosphohydrolase